MGKAMEAEAETFLSQMAAVGGERSVLQRQLAEMESQLRKSKDQIAALVAGGAAACWGHQHSDSGHSGYSDAIASDAGYSEREAW